MWHVRMFCDYKIEYRGEHDDDGITTIHSSQASPVAPNVVTKDQIPVRGVPKDDAAPERQGPGRTRVPQPVVKQNIH